MEIIKLNELKVIAGERGFTIEILEKDYLVTYLLYLLKDIEGLYFKGGTALNKIFLNHARLSEDLDFTVTRDVRKIEKEIRDKLENTIFKKITHDKRDDKFTRLVVHYNLYHEDGTIFIDLNERAKLLLKPEQHDVKHFYKEYLPSYKVNTLNTKELMSEKMAAAIGRNRPRDHFDLYMIIKKKYPIDLAIVKKKCESSGDEFNIVKIFNRANRLKNQWDQDMGQFIAKKISFITVMKTLAKHFKLKDEKKKLKETK